MNNQENIIKITYRHVSKDIMSIKRPKVKEIYRARPEDGLYRGKDRFLLDLPYIDKRVFRTL